MAKFRKYIRGSVDHVLSLGTLAGADVIGSQLVDAVEEPAFCSSVKASYAMSDFTPIIDCGPMLFGWAHSDYTDAEIEAWVENQGSWSQGDKVAQEIANRKIKQVGVFEDQPFPAGWANFADGRQVTTKLGWLLIEGQTLRFWVYNSGSVAVGTTVPDVRANGHANLWPKA